MDYQIFLQGPSTFIRVIIISLIATLCGYAAFPLLFAKYRKKYITKKRYIVLCFCVNIAVKLLFILITGESSSSAWLIWTSLFTMSGARKLKQKGIFDLQNI